MLVCGWFQMHWMQNPNRLQFLSTEVHVHFGWDAALNRNNTRLQCWKLFVLSWNFRNNWTYKEMPVQPLASPLHRTKSTRFNLSDKCFAFLNDKQVSSPFRKHLRDARKAAKLLHVGQIKHLRVGPLKDRLMPNCSWTRQTCGLHGNHYFIFGSFPFST